MVKASEQLPKVIIDDKAETIQELTAGSPLGEPFVRKFAADMVRRGKWEEVMKRHAKKGLVRAYRVKK